MNTARAKMNQMLEKLLADNGCEIVDTDVCNVHTRSMLDATADLEFSLITESAATFATAQALFAKFNATATVAEELKDETGKYFALTAAIKKSEVAKRTAELRWS